jgi:hypothetical protein
VGVVLAEPPAPDERGTGWTTDPSRMLVWAHRVWGTFRETTASSGADGGTS